jgi:hypothetical protein
VKTYFRQYQLAQRYRVSLRTIDRWKRNGILPPPDLLLPHPRWSEATIEENERTQLRHALVRGTPQSDSTNPA